MDRQLDVAISQFAPGAQTVKDDELLTSVGVVDYYPTHKGIQEQPGPLDSTISVGVCRQCQALVEEPVNLMDFAPSAAHLKKRAIEQSSWLEPPAFTTWAAAEVPFSGNFEFTPRALRGLDSAIAGCVAQGRSQFPALQWIGSDLSRQR